MPRAVRNMLGIKPGDILCYRLTKHGVLIEKAQSGEHDSFAIFSEWSGEHDERAYANL